MRRLVSAPIFGYHWVEDGAMTTRVFKFRQKSPQNENFGAVDYTITDTITERDGGLQVDSTSKGICEGDRVDTKHSKFHPGASMERAATYRLNAGYVEVK